MRHAHQQSVVQGNIWQSARQGDSVLALRLSAEGWETERQEQEYMSLSKGASISNLNTVVLAQSCASHLTRYQWSSVRRWGDERSRWLGPDLCAWIMDRIVGVDFTQALQREGRSSEVAQQTFQTRCQLQPRPLRRRLRGLWRCRELA